MASNTGYDVGVRASLASKGVDNSKIGYNNSSGMVTLDGKDFLKSDKTYNGTAFTNQQNFNNAWDAYNKGLTQQQPTATQAQPAATSTAQYNPYSAVAANQNPYSQQTDQIIQQLLNYGKNQPAYDPYSSSGYQAAQAQAQREAQKNTRAAQEAYGSAGFGRSYALGERTQGIQNDATEYLMTQVVPQLQAQEEARRQQEFNNQASMLQQLVGQQNRADTLVQNDFSNRVSEGQLTGNYMNPEASYIIDQLLGLKRQAEAKGITADERTGLNSQANTLRDQLQSLNIDPSKFGANVNANTAASNKGTVGRTIQGQELDFNQATTNRQLDRADFESDRDYKFAVGQQEWENNFKTGQFDWQKAQQVWENAFQEKNFQQQMVEAAASRGLQWANLNQNQKEFIANQAFREKEFSYMQEQDKLKNSGTTTPTAADMRTYFDSMVQRDNKNVITNIKELENAIVNSELSDYDSYQMYLRYGIPWGGPAPTKPGN